MEDASTIDDAATVGARIKVLRKWRGNMSQQTLADLAGLSQAHLSRIERGRWPLDRRSHIAGLARALRVSETDIVGGPHLSADPIQSTPHTTIPAVRAALLSNTLTSPTTERARPLAELVAEMNRIDHSEYKHIEVGEKLPAVINELHVHVAMPADEAAYQLALMTLIEAFQSATFTTKDLGYGDLAHIAAMRADEVAGILDDPISTGKAASLRVHTMSMASRDFALGLAEEAADALEPHAHDDHGVQVLGMLALAASLMATVLYRYDRAEHWLNQATEFAERIPDSPGENWGAFSASNVGAWKVALATERGESGGGLLELAREVDEDKLKVRRGRHAAFLADVGRGLARDRKNRNEAVEWLRRAEEVAPHKIRNNASVRHTVEVLHTQALDSAVSVELRGMMARMGVPH
jgi:transcriptional regulator with XRE-family HTH domain